MMKRKILAVVLPLIGCATVVGSGFAAWYFEDIQTTRGNIGTSVGVNVTKEVNDATGLLTFDSLKTVNDLDGQYLVLDQGGIKSDETKGIMIGSDTDNETKAKKDIDYSFTLTWGSTGVGQPVDLSKIYEAGMKVQLTVTIELTGNLSNYIELVTGYSLNYIEEPDTDPVTVKFDPKGSNIYTAVWEAEKPASGTTTASWNFNLGFDTSDDLKNEAFKYRASDKDGKPGKPNATGEPEAMAKDLGVSSEEQEEPKEAATVEINVVAELVDTKTGA